MQYTVIVAYDLFALDKQVKLAIADGWVPQGGLAILAPSTMSSQQKFYQAMVKTK